MNKKKDKKIIDFTVLEAADTETLEWLAEKVPPVTDKKKKEMLKMSIKKQRDAARCIHSENNQTADEFTTVSGVEQYRPRRLSKLLAAAAAFAVVAGGVTWGAYGLSRWGSAPAAEVSEAETNHRTAPFGDFAQLDFKLCSYIAAPEKVIVIKESVNSRAVYPIYGSESLSREKQEKLADFFNNYDYEELTMDSDEAMHIGEAKRVEAIVDPSDKNIFIGDMDMGEPVFICNDNNEVKALRLYHVGEIGVLNYTHFRYAEENGRYVMTDDDITVEGWKVDYELFHNTINEILFAHSVNENGQTYGTAGGITDLSLLPDLIAVVGDNGHEGYIYREDFMGEDPESPEEAVAIQESLENGTYVPKVFNVYESDGVTVIDTFTESVDYWVRNKINYAEDSRSR